LQKLQAVAHAAENLLSRLREGELVFNPDIAGALLAVVDAIRRMLADVEKDETDGEGDFSDLLQILERFRPSRGVQAPSAPPAPAEQLTAPALKEVRARREDVAPAPTIAASLVTPSDSTVPEAAESRASAISDSSIRVDVGLLDKLMNLVG